ncbi:MAG: zf-HC2 domain-containing protein [Prolixibacteraceae bacterium]
MNCKTIHQDLIFYLDNELPEERRSVVQEHLNVCADCRKFYELLKTEMQLITEEKNPEVSPFFYTRLSARLENKQDYLPQKSWSTVLQPAFFSLILLIGIYGGLKLGNNASSPSIQQNRTSNIQMLNDFEAEPIESFLLEKL